jgi:L,D-transpeptidase-like protein
MPRHAASLAVALLAAFAPAGARADAPADARADAPAESLRWVETGGVPFPASVKSVLITRDDQPLARAPRGDAPRRGSALLGVSLPLFGVRPGGVGCPSRWLLVGPQAWVCQSQVSLSAGEALAPGGWPPSPTDGLPYRYYFVGRGGTQAYARVEFADDAAPERELEPGFALAIVEERTKGGQSYGRSRRGLWVPMRDLLPARATTFRGERVEGDKLDVAFTYLDKTPVYPKPEPNVKPAGAPISRLRPLHVLEETGRGDRVYYRIGEGEWVRAADVRRPLKAPPPAGALPGEKWVDVELATQTLVAYEGERPVYATLVSTGRGPQGSDTATPRGVHRVWVKLVSSTMDNLEDENAASHYAIEDVPYVQFFAKSVGFHGTFWHDGFGRVRSHGCVNLSPVDARWLFEFSGPRLPAGWTGVLPTEFEPGLLVRVR